MNMDIFNCCTQCIKQCPLPYPGIVITGRYNILYNACVSLDIYAYMCMIITEYR